MNKVCMHEYNIPVKETLMLLLACHDVEYGHGVLEPCH